MNKNIAFKIINPILGLFLITQVLPGLLDGVLPDEIFGVFHIGGRVLLGLLAALYLRLNWRRVKMKFFHRNCQIMGMKFYRVSITMLVFMALTAGKTAAEDSKKIISIAIFPCTDEVLSFKKFNPLITYLKKETGLNLEMVVPNDLEEFERKIKSGTISFALQDPHIYNMISHQFDNSSLLGTLTRDGKDSQSGVVIVRKDSGIRQLKDLSGKTVMFGPKLSTTKWLAAKLLFEENGIHLDKDLKSYSNGKCCEDIAFSVFLKSVDAGVICDHFLGEHSQKQQELGVEAKELVVIARTKSVPTRVFAACRGVAGDIINKTNNALLNLDNRKGSDKDILFRAELGGFKKADATNYEILKILSNINAAD
ncbi:membrane hypothetical protein [uncultured Desulfobacterium sp.]|uniref:Uncharacterized protein n=1 Tax=uncultured Desulfobacterium sp. TaxID=201089 RepID=A0A445MZK1_9BACT|nr:membrane hypothetical protein [uncultured Desulfobacterium sp.]